MFRVFGKILNFAAVSTLSILAFLILVVGIFLVVALYRPAEVISPNHVFLRDLVDRHVKTLNLDGFNDGNWRALCVVGRMVAPSQFIEAFLNAGQSVVADDFSAYTPQKSRTLVVYVDAKGKVGRIDPDALQRQVAGGEIVCVTKEEPLLVLPTEAALERLRP